MRRQMALCMPEGSRFQVLGFGIHGSVQKSGKGGGRGGEGCTARAKRGQSQMAQSGGSRSGGERCSPQASTVGTAPCVPSAAGLPGTDARGGPACSPAPMHYETCKYCQSITKSAGHAPFRDRVLASSAYGKPSWYDEKLKKFNSNWGTSSMFCNTSKVQADVLQNLRVPCTAVSPIQPNPTEAANAPVIQADLCQQAFQVLSSAQCRCAQGLSPQEDCTAVSARRSAQ